jgi:hypothetical protein
MLEVATTVASPETRSDLVCGSVLKVVDSGSIPDDSPLMSQIPAICQSQTLLG